MFYVQRSRFSRESNSTDGDLHRMAELAEATDKQEWEKVEVRRPLEAVFCFECGPSRAVRLGLAQWTLEAVVARRIRPCSAESAPYAAPNPADMFYFACRLSSMPVATPILVTRALPISPSLAISRRLLRPKPLFPRPFEVSRVWRMRERRAGWGSLQVLLPLTCTKNENVVDPRGLPAVLFSGTGWVWGIL
jgi:hypothetical protein